MKGLILSGGESAMEPVSDHIGHDRRHSVDTSKVRDLGWAPERLLHDALAEMVGRCRENRAWWKPLKDRS